MMWLVIIAIIAIVAFVVISLLAKRSNELDQAFFKERWNHIENMSRTKETWVQSVIDGDKLLDEALKKLRYAGKTTADRMVSANRAFSSPDSVWQAHKLRNKVVHETRFQLKKAHVNACLKGFKQALKDLGAL